MPFSKRRTVQLLFFSAWLLAASVWISTATAGVGAVAYVKNVHPKGTPVGKALRLVRGGKDQPLDKALPDLRAGDQLFVKEGAVTVVILGTARMVTVAKGDGTVRQPDFIVPTAASGVSAKVIAFIKALIDPPDASATVMPVTRGGETCYNTVETSMPQLFRIPTLYAEHPKLAADKRTVFVSWAGGRAPFEVALAEAASSRVLAKSRVERDCTTRLLVSQLNAGEHRLSVTDANGSVLSEDHLVVGDTPPPMPRELSQASIPEEARQIYFATWLAAQEGGAWALEAQQRVAAMDCRSAAVNEWLDRWGTAPTCSPSN